MQHYLLSILVSLAFLSGYVISAFLTPFLKRKVHFVSGAILMGISQAVLGLALKAEVSRRYTNKVIININTCGFVLILTIFYRL